MKNKDIIDKLERKRKSHRESVRRYMSQPGIREKKIRRDRERRLERIASETSEERRRRKAQDSIRRKRCLENETLERRQRRLERLKRDAQLRRDRQNPLRQENEIVHRVMNIDSIRNQTTDRSLSRLEQVTQSETDEVIEIFRVEKNLMNNSRTSNNNSYFL